MDLLRTLLKTSPLKIDFEYTKSSTSPYSTEEIQSLKEWSGIELSPAVPPKDNIDSFIMPETSEKSESAILSGTDSNHQRHETEP